MFHPNTFRFAASVCSAILDGSANWPHANAQNQVNGRCVSGYSGSPSRTCLGCGEWGPISNPCVPASCPAATCGQGIPWPLTSPGSTATYSCPQGYCGNPTRTCSSSGTWGSVSGTCQTSKCAAFSDGNANWGSTNSGATAQGTCAKGYSGSPSRTCTGCGQWGPITNPCVSGPACPSGPCDQNINWPQTWPGSTASGTCPSGCTGSPTRTCNAGGVWGGVSGTCSSKSLFFIHSPSPSCG